MPERLVRQRRGLVDLYRITSSQRAEHAAVLLLRGSHFQSFRHDVPGVALDGRARRLREGLSCCSREDGEHLCSVAAPANSGAVERAFFVVALCGSVGGERLFAHRASSRGVVKRPTEVETPCPLLPRATNASCCATQAGLLGRLPRRAALVRLPASRRAIRPERRMRETRP